MLLLVFIVPFFVWLNIYLFKVFYNFIFDDEQEIENSINYTCTPDIFSSVKGEYFKDKFAEFRLSILILFCTITIVWEFCIVKGALKFLLN